MRHGGATVVVAIAVNVPSLAGVLVDVGVVAVVGEREAVAIRVSAAAARTVVAEGREVAVEVEAGVVGKIAIN